MRPIRNNVGASKFPPNPNHWNAERNGLALRARFSRPAPLPLQPFDIVRQFEGVELVEHGHLADLVGVACASELFGRSRDKWSGFVVPVDGLSLIVINHTHPITRQHATLTEELFHIVLRHRPTKIYLCPLTGLLRREYTPDLEHEAYWSAAAALIPYATLRELVRSGGTLESIAESFGVSVPLVQFRMKVTKLWRAAK